MTKFILGISAFYHDSAACLIENDKIIAAAQEERFTRVKHDSSFPLHAIKYCLAEANITIDDVSYIGYFEKPFLKFERLIETYLAESPKGFRSFTMAIPVWLKEKLFLKNTLIRNLVEVKYGGKPDDTVKKSALKYARKQLENRLLFGEHHGSHAASCFYSSPYSEAAILTIDGVGEWTTLALAHGKNNKIKFLKEIHFPHSLGLLYSALTYYLGFKVNSGEYKVMGLAPYGKPKYTSIFKEHLIDIRDDGSFRLNMKYFNYTVGLTMTNGNFNKLFGRPPRKCEEDITQFDMDLAKSLQEVTEEIVLKLAKTIKKLTDTENLVMAGGVALNCVANGKIIAAKIFKNLWVQPAAGDAGGALGIAQTIYYEYLQQPRKTNEIEDAMQGSYLGIKYSNEEVKQYLDSVGAKYHKIDKQTEFYKILATELAADKVVGWHQGRMEFGPRALGARSILGNPKSSKMQATMNLKIKYRESFRPFAPAILKENLTEYFDITDIDSPYMLIVAPIKKDLINQESVAVQEKLFGIEKLKINRSKLPAITHVDFSARIQTVSSKTNSKFYRLIKAFQEKTGCPVLINTSFNVRGEPIVCSPEDSYKCFMRTEMDILAIEDFILYKKEQPDFSDQEEWQKTYALD